MTKKKLPTEVIKAYKGFGPDMKCRDYQFEIGGEYEEKKAVACEIGFHACEHPLDVLNYYPPATSRYAGVECSGKIDHHNADTKVACTHIKIGAELNLSGIVKAAVKFVFDRADWSKTENHVAGDRGAASATGYSGAASATGDSGAASATGESGAASATGNRGAASATGDRGAASATGKHSVACGLGIECIAKASLGCGIVLVERKWDGNNYAIKNIRATKVDGKIIKADTWYQLIDEEFKEV